MIAEYFGQWMPTGERVKAFVHEGGILVFGARGRETYVVADLRGEPVLRGDIMPRLSYSMLDDPENTLCVYMGGCGCGSPLRRLSEKDFDEYMASVSSETPA